MPESKQPRVLVIGANGQVGRALLSNLQDSAEVIAATRQSSLAFDLSDSATLAGKIDQIAPDIVINAAAYTAVDKAESEPELASAINAFAPGVIADCCERRGIALIQYSTDYVFDGSKTSAYLETDTPNPVSVYGRSKLEGEQAIQASGCDYYILRTSWVYDAQGQNFLNTMLRLAQERDELSVVSDQHGSPTWTGYIAEQTSRLVEKIFAQDPAEYGLYHLTCAGQTTWFEFAQQIFNQARHRGMLTSTPALSPIATTDYPTDAQRPAFSVLSNEKINAALGITPLSWQDGLSNCLSGMIR